MQIQDFVKAYEGKSDEELMQLAAAGEQLTSEARLALQNELSRRQISIAEFSGACQDGGRWHDSGRVSVSERSEHDERQGVGDFVAEVFRTYHSHFWLFFQITAPAVIIGTIAIITGRNEAREIARGCLPTEPRFSICGSLTFRRCLLVGWLPVLRSVPFASHWKKLKPDLLRPRGILFGAFKNGWALSYAFPYCSSFFCWLPVPLPYC